MRTWVFLDFDNTLMGTEQYTLPSLISRFNALYGEKIGTPPLTIELFKAHFHGQGREVLCENLSNYFNVKVDYPLLYDSREWHIMQHFQQVPNGIPMAPFLIETLSQLISNPTHPVHLALVSNNPIQRSLCAMRYAHNGQGEVLARFFGTQYFEAGNRQKPNPDVYVRAMEQVAVTNQNSFAVEDSVTGAQAALAAGLVTFAFTGFADDPALQAEKMLALGCVEAFSDWRVFPKTLTLALAHKR